MTEEFNCHSCNIFLHCLRLVPPQSESRQARPSPPTAGHPARRPPLGTRVLLLLAARHPNHPHASRFGTRRGSARRAVLWTRPELRVVNVFVDDGQHGHTVAPQPATNCSRVTLRGRVDAHVPASGLQCAHSRRGSKPKRLVAQEQPQIPGQAWLTGHTSPVTNNSVVEIKRDSHRRMPLGSQSEFKDNRDGDSVRGKTRSACLSQKLEEMNTRTVFHPADTVDHLQNFHQGLFFGSTVADGGCGWFPASSTSPPSRVMM